MQPQAKNTANKTASLEDTLRHFIRSAVSETIREELQAQANKNDDVEASPNEPVKQILTRQEVCEMLNISLPTLHHYTKQGLINGFKIGHKVRYKRTDVLAALNQIKAPAPAVK